MNKKIQILRAISIIAVVLIHTCPNNIITIFIRPFINFAVALFLFLSGYLTNINTITNKTIKRRILRVIIPYIIWTIIYTISKPNFNLLEIPINIFTTNACYTFYFISVYIQLVLLTPLIIKIAKTKLKYLPFFIHIIWVLLIRYILLLFNITLPYLFNSIFFISWLSYYYLGILISNNIIKIKFKLHNIIFLYLISIILQIIEAIIWYYKFNNFELATSQVKLSNIITSLLFLLICYIYLNNNTKIKDNYFNNLLMSIGDLSFGIYFCHPLIITITNYFANYQKILIFPLTTIITLLIALLWLSILNNTLPKKITKYLGLN